MSSPTLRDLAGIALAFLIFCAVLGAVFTVADWHESDQCMVTGRQLGAPAQYANHTCFIQRLDGWHAV